MNDVKKPICILHIVGGMNTGGVETWLMHVLRKIDRDRYKFDFLTHTTESCFYDEEIRSLGCRIIPCLRHSLPWHYARRFLRVVKEYGPYDAVHSHVHHFSGFLLLLAHRAGVPMRIAHNHNDTSADDSQAGFYRSLYLNVSNWLIRRHATAGLTCSRLAAPVLFGHDWTRDSRWRVLYYGIDLELFTPAIDRIKVRKALGIPADTLVVGHVGRFVKQKNHDFVLDIFAEVIRRNSKARLLLVGNGPLRGAIEQKAQRLGLSDKVIFAGVRNDVPLLMRGAMDVFVFPSRHEGLGLVLIEAQAACLRYVLSDMLTRETDIIHPLIRRVSPFESARVWADTVLSLAGQRLVVTPEETIRQIRASHFDVSDTLASLQREYEGDTGPN